MKKEEWRQFVVPATGLKGQQKSKEEEEDDCHIYDVLSAHDSRPTRSILGFEKVSFFPRCLRFREIFRVGSAIEYGGIFA